MNSKIKIYAFYYIIEENILISNDFKNILLDELKKEKNKLIILLKKWKKRVKKIYGKMKKTIDLKGYKEKAKKKINDIFDKTENIWLY